MLHAYELITTCLEISRAVHARAYRQMTQLECALKVYGRTVR